MTGYDETPSTRTPGVPSKSSETASHAVSVDDTVTHLSDTAQAIATAVLDLIEQRGDGITFAEVDQYLDALGIEYTGEEGIAPVTLLERRIYVWAGVSADYRQAISALSISEQIVIRMTSPLVYYYEGKALDMPIATRLRKYKEPHWVPAVIGGAK